MNERGNERASVRTDSVGGGTGGESQSIPNGEAHECHLCWAGFKRCKLISIAVSTNDSGVELIERFQDGI